MTANSNISQSAVDFHGLNQLREQAIKNTDKNQTLKQVAGQFESLFVTMMLKSMRQASLGDGIFDSSQSKMYQDMADQQLASDLSMNGGLGLQDVIIRQLGGEESALSASAVKANQAYSIDTVTIRPALVAKMNQRMMEKIREIHAETNLNTTEYDHSKAHAKRFNSPSEFVDALWPQAQKAAEKLGVSPELLLSQAALETGWGKHVISNKAGESSFNLFNIKANPSWNGDFVAKNSLEYRDGIPVNETSHFRAYDSYQESFDDYVNFIETQPRYQKALQYTSDPEAFIEQLHKAGYATDPNYANIVKQIMNGDFLARISLETDYADNR
ncbi:MAG TPA: flagellar assembly peptidoglycan hydrolase FlgJ [Methylophaga aminisulfidivorans]|uniref:Peptidoglycan hydrolase FlgJ n=1 Tax=Methylophaga aminisulfidivorans TaxID=230105 RepID=A0A7C1ZSM9_9GAMM|nr:flagellar assembly peptidoglycan hydrolase FlgJ [Methylophaga aminisulfidivorans]